MAQWHSWVVKKTEQEEKRKEEGKVDHMRENNAEWAEKKLPLNKAFLNFLYQVSGCRYKMKLINLEY